MFTHCRPFLSVIGYAPSVSAHGRLSGVNFMRRLLVCTRVLRDYRRIAAVLSTASARAVVAVGLALTVSVSAQPPRAQDRSQADLTREDLEIVRTEYVLGRKHHRRPSRN